MIRVYVLPVERVDNTDRVVGIEFIHDAVLTYGHEQAMLIQDTTLEEHQVLSAMAIRVKKPTKAQLAMLAAVPEPTLPLVFSPPPSINAIGRLTYVEEFLSRLYPPPKT